MEHLTRRYEMLIIPHRVCEQALGGVGLDEAAVAEVLRLPAPARIQDALGEQLTYVLQCQLHDLNLA